MQISDVMKATMLTKKSIEYYTQIGLVNPAVLVNGYRDYTTKDVEILQKTRVLRKLDISTREVKKILLEQDFEALRNVTFVKKQQAQREKEKAFLLEKLQNGEAYSEIEKEVLLLEQEKTITEKLVEAFPGYYGRLFALHFSSFLDSPIKTYEQERAYEKIIEFLDNIPEMDIPEDLQKYIFGESENSPEVMPEQSQMEPEKMEAFVTENEALVKEYLSYRSSEAFKESEVGRLMEYTKQFLSQNGYNTVFIPAMLELSPSYKEYYEKLEKANQRMLESLDELK